jgi:proliferating cell nuclear antigen
MSLSAIAPTAVFEEFLAAPLTIVDEAKVRFDSDGLSLRVVDPANVAMVDVRVPADAFDAFEASEGVIGLSIDRLDEIISMANGNELVQLELNEETRKLDVEVGGKLSFTQALIDPDSIRAEPDIPDLDLPAVVGIPGSEIGRGLSAADLVSDHVRLAADPEDKAFHVAATGDTDDVDVTLNGDTLTDVDVSEPCESLFSLDYLQDIERAIPTDETVAFQLGNEMPVRFGFETDAANVECMLAPRIES